MELHGKYPHENVCEKAINNDDFFNSFKRDSEFKYMFEHTTINYGHEYLKMIFEQYDKYVLLLDWEKLKENDSIGNAEITSFIELKHYITLNNYDFSPSTMYYIYRGLDIINKLLEDKKEINILEIGGGYGGQCKLLIDMCGMLGIKINNYGIIDKKLPSKLQIKYLNHFNYSNIHYYACEDIVDYNIFKEYNIVISIYALSEFNLITQNFYVDNILTYLPNYYILCNFFMPQNLFLNNTLIEGLPITGTYHKLLLKNSTC